MCLATRPDLLLTSGSDGILRVWDRTTGFLSAKPILLFHLPLPLGSELGGYSYSTGSMVYDQLRDLIFAEVWMKCKILFH